MTVGLVPFSVLHDLSETVQHLAACLLSGTARPYVGRLTDEKRQQQAAERRQEATEREERARKTRGPFALVDPIGMGETQDLYRMDIVDLLSDVLVFADWMSEQVVTQLERDLRVWAGAWASAVPSMHRHASSHMADPEPYLRLLIDLLPEIQDERPDYFLEALRQAKRLVDKAAPVLGLIIDGQHLPHECPWCRQTDWRIRTLPERDHSLRPYVVCESDRCHPGDANVGRWWKSRPAWDLLTEGEWLARCVEAVDAARVCRCGNPLPLTSKRGRPVTSCSDDCRREADAKRKREERAA